jgi:hypothetical protein
MRFMLADSVVAFDHVRRTMSLIGPRKAVERLVVALSQPPAAAAAGLADARASADRAQSRLTYTQQRVARRRGRKAF